MPIFFKNLGILSALKGDNKVDVCDVRLRAKQSISTSESKANNLFDLIYCDIWGPYRVKISCCASYFLTIVDDASMAMWVYLMKEKSEVSVLLKGFMAMANNQFGKGMKVIRSDNGLEF